MSVSFDKPLPQFQPQSELWFLDFCPRAQQLVELLDAGHLVTILDHHLTAKEVLDTVQSPNLRAVLDMDHSGAVITWKHFFPRRKVPMLLLYVEDRDLWRLQYDETEAITEGLHALNWTFDLWTRLHTNASDLDQLVRSGSLLISAKKTHITRIMERVYFEEVGGYEVPTVNTDSYISDVGAALARAHPDKAFAAIWFQLPDGRRKWSLRSAGEFNVAEIAKRYGGGGHKNAAGFIK
jgi:oligoribonuclease NrnB/cAMP/cGMP phosphodiesterase (DHH superfamily)